jgi:hypothetical protein
MAAHPAAVRCILLLLQQLNLLSTIGGMRKCPTDA